MVRIKYVPFDIPGVRLPEVVLYGTVRGIAVALRATEQYYYGVLLVHANPAKNVTMTYDISYSRTISTTT